MPSDENFKAVSIYQMWRLGRKTRRLNQSDSKQWLAQF